MKTGSRILIIDDDRDFVQALVALLEREGPTVLHRAAGAACCAQQGPDLILPTLMEERTAGSSSPSCAGSG
jgi:CheY-like chemotaxis protein